MTDKRSYTSWERLIPVTSSTELGGTLRGELADPLWLLARQWQFGEFAGTDGGSPVDIDLAYHSDHVSRVQIGESEPFSVSYRRDDVDDNSNDESQTLSRVETSPLEALIEREPIGSKADSGPNMRIRAEAGMHFLDRLRRALDAQGQETLPVSADFPMFGLTRPTVADADSRRYYNVLGSTGDEPRRGEPVNSSDRPIARALDGHDIYRAVISANPALTDSSSSVDPSSTVDWTGIDIVAVLHPENDSTGETPPAAVSLAYEAAAEGFVEWYEDLFSEPTPQQDAWDPDRLEYSATLSAGSPTDETVFDLDEYRGGHLDWYDFSVSDRESLSPEESASESPESISELPGRASFRGMPAARLWEFEDAAVDLSAVEAAPDDTSRLLLLEYALIAGNDWFVLPIETTVGSVTRISNPIIEDTFNDPTEVKPTVNRADATDWSLFTHNLPKHDEPGLFIPPTLGTSSHGETIEDVLFSRDEIANLVFAVEETVENPLGNPLPRIEFSLPRLEIGTINSSSDPEEEFIELTNQGDDSLPIDGWQLTIETDTGQVEFVYSFKGITLSSRKGLRLYLDGSPELDTDERIHAGQGGDQPILTADQQVIIKTAPDAEKPVAVKPVLLEAHPAGLLPQYQLVSNLPEYWFPYVPTPETSEYHRFVPGLLLDADALGGTANAVPKPLGSIISPTARIYEEEIPRGGVNVTRQYQSTPWIDGSTYVWSGRRVRPGKGETYSGLKYDYLIEPEI